MRSKRDVLDQLKRDELLDAVDQAGLEVRDRRVRGELVDVLAGSRKVPLAEVLRWRARSRRGRWGRGAKARSAKTSSKPTWSTASAASTPRSPTGGMFVQSEKFIEAHSGIRGSHAEAGGNPDRNPDKVSG